MSKVDNRVPVTSETRDRLRALKQQDQTYEQLIRVMAALYEQMDHRAVQEMSGRERIKARANDQTPVEYVYDLDVDLSDVEAGQAVNGTGTDDDGFSGGVNDVADAALGGRERVEADHRDLSPEEYVWEEFGLDASNYDDPTDLRDDIHAQAQADDGVRERKKPDDFDQPATGQQSDADALAGKALSGQDRVAVKASDQTPADYVRQEYGVDPADYADPGDLRTAMGGQ
jgi:hypothetical protein